MGREARVAATIDDWNGTGKLLLETDELVFRGDRRMVVARAAITNVAANGDWLEIGWEGRSARFEVGRTAPRWVDDILNPKSRIDKLDLKPGARVAFVSLRDSEFTDEVRARVGRLDQRIGKGPYDAIFFRTDDPRDFGRLPDLRSRLKPAGAVWIITPKGVPAMGHNPVVQGAKAAGLVDVKTARFSETHTALKLVIPKAER